MTKNHDLLTTSHQKIDRLIFTMHLKQPKMYEKFLILTRLARFCASSTECSEHVLRKLRLRKLFFQIIVVFRLDVINVSDLKIYFRHFKQRY